MGNGACSGDCGSDGNNEIPRESALADEHLLKELNDTKDNQKYVLTHPFRPPKDHPLDRLTLDLDEAKTNPSKPHPLDALKTADLSLSLSSIHPQRQSVERCSYVLKRIDGRDGVTPTFGQPYGQYLEQPISYNRRLFGQ